MPDCGPAPGLTWILSAASAMELERAAAGRGAAATTDLKETLLVYQDCARSWVLAGKARAECTSGLLEKAIIGATRSKNDMASGRHERATRLGGTSEQHKNLERKFGAISRGQLSKMGEFDRKIPTHGTKSNFYRCPRRVWQTISLLR